jgi:hypothetical protein
MAVQPDRNRKTLHVGLVGHRELGDARMVAKVRLEAARHFRVWWRSFSAITALSPLAIGADSLLAEVSLRQGCRLIAIVPFSGYEEEFGPGERSHYLELRGQAAEVVQLPARQRSREAFQIAGRWIVDNADLLLTVWDGQPARNIGGTAETVAYAHAQGKEVVHIQVCR